MNLQEIKSCGQIRSLKIQSVQTKKLCERDGLMLNDIKKCIYLRKSGLQLKQNLEFTSRFLV